MALKLHTIICSTRPGRVGLPVGQWFHGVAQKHGKFDATLVDLKEVNLPLYDEPQHPRLKKYEHAHTKAWSAIVDAADAFVFVMPEYNHTMAPSMVNAVAYLNAEWAYKPAAFVSYGAIAAGARAVAAAKVMLTAVKVMPMFESVAIPMVATQIKDGAFNANEGQATAANVALNELHKWAEGLKVLRGK